MYPMCQDTGTAIIMAKKGQQVWTWSDDEEELSKGVFEAYTQNYLRYSQNAPLTMYQEKNTKTNLPAQVDIAAVRGDEYRFLFMAKGGGSANKTALFQMTKAVLNSEDTLLDFMTEKNKSSGHDCLSALSHRLCDRRHICGDQSQGRETGIGPVSGYTACQRQ